MEGGEGASGAAHASVPGAAVGGPGERLPQTHRRKAVPPASSPGEPRAGASTGLRGDNLSIEKIMTTMMTTHDYSLQNKVRVYESVLTHN